MKLAIALIEDERAFVVTIELLLIVTIVVIGLIAGLTALRNAIVNELEDVGRAISEMDQQIVPETEELLLESAGASNATQRPDNCVQVYLSPGRPGF